MAESLCWRLFFVMLVIFCVFNRSSTSQTCHQLIWFPTSVTNNDVTYKLSLEFTYAIDKPDCSIDQVETPKDLKISFSNDKCVTKKNVTQNDPGHIFYSLSLVITNDNIVVTGPEKITIECKVPNVKEVPLI